MNIIIGTYMYIIYTYIILWYFNCCIFYYSTCNGLNLSIHDTSCLKSKFSTLKQIIYFLRISRKILKLIIPKTTTIRFQSPPKEVYWTHRRFQSKTS